MEEKGWVKLHDRSGRTYRVSKESAVEVQQYGTSLDCCGAQFKCVGEGDNFYELLLDFNETGFRLTATEVMKLGKWMIAEAKKMMESEEVFNE